MTRGLESFLVYSETCGIQIIFKVQWTESKEICSHVYEQYTNRSNAELWLSH